MAEKFTFTEDLYSFIMLLPKFKRNSYFKKVIEYGLYDIQPKVKKNEKAIWDNIVKHIRKEKAQRYVRQINGQLGGRKHQTRPKMIKKNVKNLEVSKKNLEVSKSKQKKVTKQDVYLFCIANGYAFDEIEIERQYQIAVSHPDNWRDFLRKELKQNI